MEQQINIPGFELIEEIGAGGMAKVYLGMQTLLERKVAIKVLHSRLSESSDEFKQRFFYEGKVLAKLQHDNIVSIIDIGEADGQLYMIMEYVEGGTLGDVLKVQQITVDQSVQICSKVGLALHTTHLNNIVHRDLKPSNILLRDIHTPLLTDFGIARQTDTDQGLTQTGHIVGTIQYMSPEQIRGLSIDRRSDIYSLGLMFYRLLVGQLPFVASSQYDLSRMQCEEPPPPLPPQLSEFQRVMDTMLAKDPNDRFDTGLEFCKALQSLSTIDEDFASELTASTRIFDSGQLSYPTQGSYRTSSGTRSMTARTSQQYSRDRSQEYDATRMMHPAGHSDGLSLGSGQAGSGKLKKMLMLGLPVLAFVLVTVLYFALWHTPSTGLSEEQQRRVDRYLEQVDSFITVGQIEDPPGRNAIEALNSALRLAPDYPPAMELGEEIAEYFEFNAMDLQDAGQLEEAMAEVDKGLAIAPEYTNLLALQANIQDTLDALKLEADLADALQLARSYEAAGQLTSPEGENAYEVFQSMLEMQAGNTDAADGLGRILAQIVVEIRDSLNSDNLELAENRVSFASGLFPNEPSINRLRTQITDRRTAIREQEEVDQFLAQADNQMSAGRYLEPAGDNALESFNEVIRRQPDNQRANAGLETIGQVFGQRAQEALDRGEYREALRLVDTGFSATPDNAMLAEIQSQARGQLGARDREIEDTLQSGRDLLLAGRFLPPGDNALDTFRSVEVLDPGNSQAAAAIARLPDQVYDGVVGMQRLGNLRGARDLALAAESAFASDGRFATVKTNLETAIAQQDREERLGDLLASSAAAVAVRPVSLTSIDQAAVALAAVEAEFSGNVTASTQTSNLIAAIREEALRPGGSEEGGFVLLDHALSKFEGNQRLLTARSSLEQRRDQRIAAEQAARAALMGKLVIDAVPWGEITEIRNADGEVEPLPSLRTTPLLLDLMAGKYTISINNGNGGSTQKVEVDVAAQQTATHIEEFGTLTAEQYFQRSGWWQ